MTTHSKIHEAGEGSGTWSSRREQLLEVSVFLLLIVPSMALSFFAIKQGTLSFVLTACAAILRDLALVGLILFFLWRNQEPVARIGWTSMNAWKDIAWGVVLFVPCFLGASLLERALLAAGLSKPSTPLPSLLPDTDMAHLLLVLVLVTVVAISEESIFRGYLMLRLRAVTASSVAAAILSAAVFSLGHGYEGSAGVVTVGVMGLAFALLYLWRRSLVAPMILHFLQDLIGIVVLPFLGRG